MKKILPFVFLLACLGCNFKEWPIIKGTIREMDERRTEEANRIIREHPKFAELSKICSVVSVPEGSKLISKSVSGHGFAISDIYFSDMPREEIYSFIAKGLTDSGWEKTGEVEFMGHEMFDFSKDGYRINLQLGGLGTTANFSIWCEDSKTMEQPSN